MNFRDADYLREWDAQARIVTGGVHFGGDSPVGYPDGFMRPLRSSIPRACGLTRERAKIRLRVLADLARDGQRSTPRFVAQIEATLEAFGC
jgi:hypothetical protein